MTGAAALIDERRRALAGFFWTPRSRSGAQVWEMAAALRRGEAGLDPAAPFWTTRKTCGTLGGVGEGIREIVRETTGGRGYLLAGENAVVGRGVQSSLTTARNGGRVLGPLESLASGQAAEWVEAVRWRALLLGLPVKTEREEAKRQSRRLMPARIEGLQEIVRLLGDADDLTDAAGVAEWLLVTTTSRGSSEPVQKRPRGRSSGPGASSGRRRGGPRR